MSRTRMNRPKLDPRNPTVIRSAERIMQRAQMKKNPRGFNCCGYCEKAYRDNVGNVMCGKAQLGEQHVIKKAFDEGCRAWKPRKAFQPPVFVKQSDNSRYAKLVRFSEMAQIGRASCRERV